MSDLREQPQACPPEPPSFDRRVTIPRGQLCGLLLLAALPLLAAFGVFGSAERTFTADGGGVSLAVSYTERLRYGHPTRLKIHVQAAERGAPLHGVSVRVDTALLDRFDDVAATPQPDTVTTQGYGFEVPDGVNNAVMIIDAEPERYGEASGRITVVTPAGAAVEVPVRVIILP